MEINIRRKVMEFALKVLIYLVAHGGSFYGRAEKNALGK